MQISAGWIKGEIKNQERCILIDASYITNFPEDIMVALLYVLGRWTEDEYRNSFYVEHEPAQSRWTIKLENEDLVFREITYRNGLILLTLGEDIHNHIVLNMCLFCHLPVNSLSMIIPEKNNQEMDS